MNRFFAVIALIACIVMPSLASAQRRYSSYGRVVNAATLDASSSTFAVNLNNADTAGVWDLMDVWINVSTDADNSVTAITLACTASRDGGTTDFAMQWCSTAAGVCTSSSTSFVKNPSAMSTKAWVWRLPVAAYPEIECTITDTGGDDNDVMSVWVSFGTQG